MADSICLTHTIRDVSLKELPTGEFQTEILSMPEISTEHKFLRLNLKVHGPVEPARLINDHVEVFLGNIPVNRHFQRT